MSNKRSCPIDPDKITFEEIEIFGAPALYTREYIDKDCISELVDNGDIYYYELEYDNSKQSANSITTEASNFAGTIITLGALDIDRVICYENDDIVRDTGYCSSIEEFIETYGES